MSVRILGVEFYPITLQGAVSALEWMMSREDNCTRLVVTANPIMVMTAQRDPEFMDILENAHLIVPDGMGILWAARKQGVKLPERVTGVDLADALLRKKPSPRFFFAGGKPGVAEKAAENVVKSIPGVRICGTHHGYFMPEEEQQVAEKIASARPDVIFCAMGSPRQEKFLWKYRNRLGAKVGIGLGGVLDVLSGAKKRAPGRVQEAGLEWLWRMVLEPARIWRNLALLEFAARVQLLSMFDRTREKGESHNAESREQGESDTVY
ncbi:MAG: WecB/TagA/CpsF family glycosyltransferase [Firmicutes bacterium]|nr:WecB/TagA/CpsF family glycosyltransferase [Candidatus Fermentithermobacillaceae bacterium]